MTNTSHRLLSKRIAMKIARRPKDAPKPDDVVRTETAQVLRNMRRFFNAG
jgi:hypothetical protein